MRKFLFIALALLLACPAADAAPTCKAKKNQTVRYDKKTKKCVYKKCRVKAGATLTVANNKCVYVAKRDYGSWVMSRSTDVLTGSVKVTASLVSDISYYTGTREDYATLVMRCANNELDVFIAANDFLDNDGVDVAWRWGSSTTITNQTWTESVDGSAAFYPFEKYVGTLIQNLAKGGQFIIRFENYGSPAGHSDGVFSTGSGATNAAEDVLAACPGVDQFCPFGQTC